MISRRELLGIGAASLISMDEPNARRARGSKLPQRQPNVLVFFTDQQRWDTCGCYHDSPLHLTPNLDRLATEGTLVRHSFTVQPVCAPARACLQTGLYGTQHGVWRNGLPLTPNHKTLAHYFAEAGYHTAYIGKWHLACTGVKPVPRELRGGYEEWLAADVLEMTSHPYDFRVFDTGNRPYHRAGYRVDAQTDCVLDFLRRQAQEKKRPFFLFTSYLEPHFQNDMKRFVAPDGYADRYRNNLYAPPDLVHAGKGDWPQELPDYYGMCASLDENLGRVLAALDELNLRENTILLFASDHGCHFRTRNDEYKRSCHESSIRVPTVFTGPGFRKGHVIDELVAIPDWSATLLDAAGIKVPDTFMGRSILPLIHGHHSSWPSEVFIQISESQVGRALRTKRWKYGVNAPGADGWRESAAGEYRDQYLYDLHADPWETHNLVAQPKYRQVLEELATILTKRMEAVGEAAPKIRRAWD